MTKSALMTASPECDYPIVPSLPDAGPSGLCIQHLIDAVEVQLQTPILHSLTAIINILASGKTPTVLSAFLAGGNLTALNKSKAGGPFDVCPITIGEALPCLTGKWRCAMVKVKATDFFQFGVACSFGAEKIAEAHGLRARIEEHWGEDDFAVLKIDMRNAFNVLSLSHSFLCVQSIFQSCYPGQAGATANTLFCGIHLGI